METLTNINENQLENQLRELWERLQSMTQEETKDCGDVALLWHLAEQLDLVNILDQAAGKRAQGQSVGLLTVLMAIHRDVVAPQLSVVIESIG